MGIAELVLKKAYNRIKKEKFVLYPMGDYGIHIKQYLNMVMKINEYAIIDKGLADYITDYYTVDSIEDLEGYEDCVYLITSSGDKFSKYLVEKGISQANIINIWENDDNTIMNCFIYIINNGNYKKILDYNGFLHNYGQISKSFFSTVEDKYYIMEDVDFSVINNDINITTNLYCSNLFYDVCIIFNAGIKNDELVNVINDCHNKNVDVYVLSKSEIQLENETINFMYSNIYVYSMKNRKEQDGK